MMDDDADEAVCVCVCVCVCETGNPTCRGDVALVRSRRELARRIETETSNGNALSCRVMLWEGAWEVEQIVLKTLLKAP
jgi:hypothetical protein